MNKVYLLKYYYNQYEQLDGYVKAIFKEMPDFHKLKSFFESHPDDTPHSQGKTLDACIGMLARGEEVCEYSCGGGDRWKIVEKELL